MCCCYGAKVVEGWAGESTEWMMSNAGAEERQAG